MGILTKLVKPTISFATDHDEDLLVAAGPDHLRHSLLGFGAQCIQHTTRAPHVGALQGGDP